MRKLVQSLLKEKMMKVMSIRSWEVLVFCQWTHWCEFRLKLPYVLSFFCCIFKLV